MAVIYDYCCKKCWFTWKSSTRVKECPKCGSKIIDMEYEVTQ